MKIGIMANGPHNYIPKLPESNEMDMWIGVDRGTLTLIQHDIPVQIAIGDFDSVNKQELDTITSVVHHFEKHPVEKNETDLELAILKALTYEPKEMYLFGATGGRFDHTLVNIQLLLPVVQKGIKAVMIDKKNYLQLTLPGKHTIVNDHLYENISFIPLSKQVTGLTLTNFYYPLMNKTIEMGSTLTISNKLIRKYGTFSYTKGILLVVKSCD